MNIKSGIFTIALSFIIVYACNGQERLSLEQCIRIAQDKSISIKQALLSETDAEINHKYAKRQLLPSLDGSSNFGYNIGRRVSPITNTYISESFFSQSYGLSSGIIIYNGNRIRNNVKKALLDKKASEENTHQIERDIAMLVTNYYLVILFAQENLNNSLSQYESSKEQLEKAFKLIEAGVSPASAALNLEAQVLMDEQRTIARNNDLEKAYLDLKNLLLIDMNKDIEVIVPDTEAMLITKQYESSLPELIEKSMRYQPDLAASEYRIQSSEIGRKIARSSLLPSLSLFTGITTDYVNKARDIAGFNTGYSYSDFLINEVPVTVGVPFQEPIFTKKPYFDQLNNNLGFGVMVQLRIPIHDNYLSKANIRRAKLGVESAKLQKEQLIQNIKSRVQSALADQRAAKLQYEALQKVNQAQRAAFENSQKQYEAGVLSIYDYLNARNMYDQSQNNLVISKYDFLFRTKILDFYLGEEISF
jgi:outer membrane protein